MVVISAAADNSGLDTPLWVYATIIAILCILFFVCLRKQTHDRDGVPRKNRNLLPRRKTRKHRKK